MKQEAPLTPLEKTAYHEAGHAIMAFLVRWKFKYLSIEPGEDSLGHILLQGFGSSVDFEIDSFEKIRTKLEPHIMIEYAGFITQLHLTKRRNFRGATNDFENISDVIRLCGTQKEAEAYLHWLYIRTEKIITNPQNWNAIKSLAQELLKLKTIKYPLARKIIMKAFSAMTHP